jgi:DNA-binding CsgD family transcriptional regulator
MKRDYKPRRREKIYNEHLQQIAEKKFTIREIDIIACILHNRGEKKIAYFLGISYRTVGTHVRNILSKLEYNSRDHIIDAVEKSGKMRYIREYYLQLVVESTFEKYLQKIRTSINCAQIVCFTDFGEVTDDEERLLFQLEQDLKLANLVLKHNMTSNDRTKKEYNLYFIKEKFVTSATVDINALNDQDKNIGLLLDKNIIIPPSGRVIDFREDQCYYSSVLNLLQEVISASEIKKTIQEFKNQIQIIIQDSIVEPKIELFDVSTYKLKPRIIVITVFSIILLSGIFLQYNGLILPRTKVDLMEAQQDSLSLKDSIHLLLKFSQNLSVSNLSREESEKNYKVIKQFDSVIEQIDLGQIQKYFNSDVLQSSELVNCLYNLNAISSYLLVEKHDVQKAEKILRYTKNLAENYVSLVVDYKGDQTKVQIDFDKLTPAEIYTELAMIKDLPEMYTITLYFLGRSLIYQRNLGKLEEAEKYFVLSSYLGNKLGLFEEVLSIINGVMIIKGDNIDINIENKNYEQAREVLKECIELVKTIKEDNREYQVNYKPYNKNPTFIIPKKNTYHILDCTKRLVKLYTKLVTMVDDEGELKKSLEEISQQFIGSNTSAGILKILLKSSDKPNRIVADIYNNLGYFLLKLYDKNIGLTQFKANLSSQLKLANGDDIKIIYQIFDLAKSLSRSTEFSKADSFDGLLKVCERLVRQPAIAEEEKKQLLKKIQDFKEARDEINTKLKRVVAN